MTEATLEACQTFMPWWADALAAGSTQEHARELAQRLSSPALFVCGEALWANDAGMLDDGLRTRAAQQSQRVVLNLVCR